MNEFLANPSLTTTVLYCAACLLNFLAALWMATYRGRFHGKDPWVFRTAIMLIGLFYVIITVSMFKVLNLAPHPGFHYEASHLGWWWALAVLGLMVLVNLTGRIPETIMRAATYVGAVMALWGTYVVFTEQDHFGSVATYYGFFGANLAAAVWVIAYALFDPELVRRRKRAIILAAGTGYAAVTLSAVYTMLMIAVSAY